MSKEQKQPTKIGRKSTTPSKKHTEPAPMIIVSPNINKIPIRRKRIHEPEKPSKSKRVGSECRQQLMIITDTTTQPFYSEYRIAAENSKQMLINNQCTKSEENGIVDKLLDDIDYTYKPYTFIPLSSISDENFVKVRDTVLFSPSFDYYPPEDREKIIQETKRRGMGEWLKMGENKSRIDAVKKQWKMERKQKQKEEEKAYKELKKAQTFKIRL